VVLTGDDTVTVKLASVDDETRCLTFDLDGDTAEFCFDVPVTPM